MIRIDSCLFFFKHIVQPKGVRVIRQVIGPAQLSTMGQIGIQQQIPQMYSSIG
jgi:hypothetical protein